MNWKDPKIELPEVKNGHENVRCLGFCETGSGGIWTGFVDISYNPNIGWKRCEDERSTVYVIKWIYHDEVEGINEKSQY